MAQKSNNLNDIPICTDVLQIVFGYLKWQTYYEICNFYNFPSNYDAYFAEMNPKAYPKIDKICNVKVEHLNLVKYLLNFFSTYQQTSKNYVKRYTNSRLAKAFDKAFDNACKNKHRLLIDQLLNFYDNHEPTIATLCVLCKAGRVDMLQSFIKKNIICEKDNDQCILSEYLKSNAMDPLILMKYSLAYGHCEMVEYLHKEHLIDFTKNILDDACLSGNIELCEYIHKMFPSTIIHRPYRLFELCKKGDINMIKFLHENSLSDYSCYLMYYALSCKNIEVIRFCKSLNLSIYSNHYDHKIRNSDMLKDAFRKGNINLINCLLEMYPKEISDKIKYDYKYAAAGGHLDLIQWALNKGYRWDYDISALAAEHGHLHILEWAREKGYPWNYNICASAALNGNLRIIKWARCSNDINGIKNNDNNGTKNNDNNGTKNNDNNGTKNNDNDGSKHDGRWEKMICANAALNGHLDVLIWILKNGCPWDEETCEYAVRGGRLDILKWILEYGIKPDDNMNKNVCAIAADEGNLDILKWARENNYPWDEKVCENAACNGHFEVLKWACDNGCHWNEKVCKYAITGIKINDNTGAIEYYNKFWHTHFKNYFDVFKWAVENGCPWDIKTCITLAKTYKRVSILNWIENNFTHNSNNTPL
jgi:hypothetical protein